VGQWYETVEYQGDGTKVDRPWLTIPPVNNSTITSEGRFASAVEDILGKIWAAPNTLLGVIVGLIDVGIGELIGNDTDIIFANNAITFLGGGLGRGAVTLGNSIIYAHDATPGSAPQPYGNAEDVAKFANIKMKLGDHEEAHTYQYQTWGPLFLPAYFANVVVSALFTGNVTKFEAAADAYAAARGERIPIPSRIIERQDLPPPSGT
jgi:hypothetical protein